MHALRTLGIFYIFVALAVGMILLLAEGHFTYGLDDAYIHLALAKQFVQHGVWGVTPLEPSACSSSIVWPLLLSGGVYVFGLNELLPLALSLLLATGLLLWLNHTISRYNSSGSRSGAFLFFIVFTSCIAEILFVGMEHVLQVWMCLWFAHQAAVVLSEPKPTFRSAWPLLLLAPLLASARYEGLGLVAAVCVMLTLRNGLRNFFGKGFLIGCLVCASALLPVLLFGLAMHRLDLPFLPYSVQLKTWTPHVAFGGLWFHLGPKFILNALSHPELVFLLLACLYTLRANYKSGQSFWRVPSVLQAIFVIACILHMEFASTGLYARYIAYLTSMGVLALGLEAGPLFEQGLRLRPKSEYSGRLTRFVATGAVVMLLLYAAVGHLLVPQRSRNIYQQQVQMARFLGTSYKGQAVALNDIGTSAFSTDIILVDIFGLASKEVAETRLRGEYGMEDIDRITRSKDVQIAMVYKNWFETVEGSILPPQWECVGEWKIPLNVICGWHTVSIYAVAPGAKTTLVENLKDFSEELPASVIQRGVYVETSSSVEAQRPMENGLTGVRAKLAQSNGQEG
jgi:hypothetical protein